MSSYAISIENLTKKVGEYSILDNVSFSMKEKEMFGVVGLNGAGKTTLIRLMMDLLRKDKGHISFFGESHLLPQSRRHLAYLPEKFQPSLFLKGSELIRLTLSFYKKKATLHEMEEMAEQLGLDPRCLSQPIRKYSKGMGQKLGLVALFLCDTPLFILDEPMSGLDPKSRLLLKEMMLCLRKKGHSLFFTSHILNDMEILCDTIAVLIDQKIVFTGKTQEYKDLYEASTLEDGFLKNIDHVGCARII